MSDPALRKQLRAGLAAWWASRMDYRTQMTTATEHHDAQLAAIKARHDDVARQFADPAVTVIEDGITDFGMIHQVGLMSVYLDPIGRFWTVTVGGELRRITARMVFDPGPRILGMSHGDRFTTMTIRDVTPPQPLGATMSFQQYRRTQIAEMRPWQPCDDMSWVSVSKPDKDAGSPKAGDMIARNPKNHDDQWLVAAQYFADNFEPVPDIDPDDTQAAQGFKAHEG